MLKININEQTFNLPSEWSEVSLRNYIDIINVQSDDKSSAIESFIKTLVLLSGDKEIEYHIAALQVEQFTQIQDAFRWIGIEPEHPKEQKNYFLIGKEKWSLKDNFNKLTVGESVSIEMLMKDRKMDLTPMEIAFGVLFRKMKEDGTLEAFNPDTIGFIVNEQSKNIKITDVYNLVNFFLPGGKKLSSSNSKGFSIVLQKETTKNTTSKEKKMKTK